MVLFTWVRRLLRLPPCNIWLRYGSGDGHKHGCLDARVITLSFRWISQSRATSGIPVCFASRRCTEQEFQHADISNSWVYVPIRHAQ